MATSSNFISIPTESPINPVESDYRSIVVGTSSTSLYWPTSTNYDNVVIARIMEIATSGGEVIFPDARSQSLGWDTLVKNTGSVELTLIGYSELGEYVPLATIQPSQAIYLYLKDNTTTYGTWELVYFGAGSATVSSTDLQGLGIIAIGGSLNTTLPAVSSDFLSISLNQRAQLLVWEGGTFTCDLPSISDVAPYKFWFGVRNQGTGILTFTPAGSELINAQASLTLTPGDSCLVCSPLPGGSSWYTVGLGQPPGTFNYTILNVSSVGGTRTLTSIEAQNTGLLITGALTADLTIVVPETQNVYFTNNQTTGSYVVRVKTSGGTSHTLVQGATEIITCDGTNIFNAVSVGSGGSGTSGPFASGSSTNPSITFLAALATGFFNPSTDAVGFTSTGTASLKFSASGVTFLTATAASGTRASLNVVSQDETLAYIIALG